MATDTLTAVREQANSQPTLYDLATNIQIQASRIDSLADAIDDALDFSTDPGPVRLALGRALDYVNLIKEAAEKARASGEEAEVLAMMARKVAQP